jgi:hypothetical protein
MKLYRLCFEEYDLGKIVEEGADFPSRFGRWIPDLDYSSEVAKRIREYVNYSVKSGQLFDATNGGPEWEEFIATHEPKFEDLIESNQWHLIEPDGTRIGILVPNFLPDDKVVWRDHSISG